LELNNDTRNLGKISKLAWLSAVSKNSLEFMQIKPWSIFVVETMTYDDLTLNFNYHDNIKGLTFSIRMGGHGILASF
jgi:hypothetical protein